LADNNNCVQQKYASATESPVDINAAEVHIICEDWGAAADLFNSDEENCVAISTEDV
jgi:hypothetical protein